MIPNFTRSRACFVLVVMLFGLLPEMSQAYGKREQKKFQRSIIDYGHKLNPRFKKIKRRKTDYIIVHTAELGLSATLRVVSRGKKLKNKHTPGGHANYVVARNGQVYRTLAHRYRADHAGLSMWNGRTNISNVSVGIEFVGYHDAPMTPRQYESAKLLIKTLQKVYGLDDRDVLTHSQVAYGRPNPWFKTNHRGRKRCAKNFDRSRAGLGPTWAYDPDVRTRRLQEDAVLAGVFYKGRVQEPILRPGGDGMVISKTNSAWAIAGGEYNAGTTLYTLPDGRNLTGDRVESVMGWTRLPVGTRVRLNQKIKTEPIRRHTPVKTIEGENTAWSHAGPAYKKKTTFYFLPSGISSPGSDISDWDDLSPGTRLIVGYKGPFEITKARTAYKIAGAKYQDPRVVYSLPGGQVVTGDKMTDFSNLPRGVRIYLPVVF